MYPKTSRSIRQKPIRAALTGLAGIVAVEAITRTLFLTAVALSEASRGVTPLTLSDVFWIPFLSAFTALTETPVAVQFATADLAKLQGEPEWVAGVFACYAIATFAVAGLYSRYSGLSE